MSELFNLYDKDASVIFYERRYRKGYMDEWPAQKKQRVFDMIQNFKLPASGVALDFGCGNGVLTEVLRESLPNGWKVWGSDVSAAAIENAQRWFRDCTFFTLDDVALIDAKFDLLFTHHVLEHVYDLPKIINVMNSYTKPTSVMFHILPCGNQHSFEHNLCLMRSDGIDPSREHRFYFEEEGHLRRLTTDQMKELFRPFGFELVKGRYANQYHGAIDWITRSRPSFIWRLTNPRAATSSDMARRLGRLRVILLTLWALRYPAALLESRLRKRRRSFSDWLLIAGTIPLYIFTKPTDFCLGRKARSEWLNGNAQPNGSEMYLEFRRGANW